MEFTPENKLAPAWLDHCPAGQGIVRGTQAQAIPWNLDVVAWARYQPKARSKRSAGFTSAYGGIDIVVEAEYILNLTMIYHETEASSC